MMVPKRNPVNRILWVLFVSGVALNLSGCAVWDFMETRYQNATGFFNTYYNAKKLFDEAVEEIDSQNSQMSIAKQAGGDLPDGMNIPQSDQAGFRLARKEVGISSSTVQKLDRVIEKCSRLLVQYPKSKWVDDALLMIGRSYYYKREYGRAERKFKELLESFPNGDLYAEGLLWMGKNYMFLELFDQSEERLRAAIERATAENEPDIVSDAYFALGELFLVQEQKEKAVGVLQQGLRIKSDRDRQIKLQLALANEQEKVGNLKAAAASYREIIRLSPSKELLFKAQINYARLARETGQYEDAATTRIYMLENPAFIENDGEIQIEIGHFYVATEEFKSAVDQFVYVDTTFRNQAVAADANYALGKLYELQVKDYDRAFERYNSAKLAYPGTPSAARGGEKAEAFGEYRRTRIKMYDLDTLLFFVLRPDSLARRDSLRALADSVARLERDEDADSQKTEEQLMADRFKRRRPHGRNTGRINPWLGMPSSSITAGASQAVVATTQANPTLPLYRRYNLHELSPDSLLTELSLLRLEMGWIMFDRIGNIDSAMFYYQFGLEGRLPDSTKANAYYALAEIARRLGDSSLAVDYEDRLIRELPRSRFAHSIMRARGLTIPRDSNAVALDAYERAAAVLERGSIQQGIRDLQAMTQNYPHTSEAPRAQLAIAMTYESMPGMGEKAIEVYKEMVKNYPNSRYSKRAHEVLETIKGPPPSDQPVEDVSAPKKPEPTVKKQKTVRELELEAENKAKHDPTHDDDFPLNLPGAKKPKDPKQKEPAQGESGADGQTQQPLNQPPVPLTPPESEPQPLPSPVTPPPSEKKPG